MSLRESMDKFKHKEGSACEKDRATQRKDSTFHWVKVIQLPMCFTLSPIEVNVYRSMASHISPQLVITYHDPFISPKLGIFFSGIRFTQVCHSHDELYADELKADRRHFP